MNPVDIPYLMVLNDDIDRIKHLLAVDNHNHSYRMLIAKGLLALATGTDTTPVQPELVNALVQLGMVNSSSLLTDKGKDYLFHWYNSFDYDYPRTTD